MNTDTDRCAKPAAPVVPPEPFGYFKPFVDGWMDCKETDEGARPLYEAPQPQADALDAELLSFLQDQSIDLRCFNSSDGEDVGWRTVQHHMSEPRERVVSEVYGDQPRRAIREAMARIERDPYCTGPLHLEDDAAIAAAKEK